MKKVMTISIAVALVVAFTMTALAIAPNARRPFQQEGPQNGAIMTPPFNTVDQITHDRGNIVTTVDNFGYIGGYYFYDLPSGEWPRNSGHNYIGEMMYWMGAVTASGDTLVADAVEDFQGMPSIVDNQPEYKILLSSDTSRYYDFDPSDTTGAGTGQAARGWRIWDPRRSVWDYNAVYDQLASAYDSTSGPTSLQDSHYRFNDAALGTSLLGLEVPEQMAAENLLSEE